MRFRLITDSHDFSVGDFVIVNNGDFVRHRGALSVPSRVRLEDLRLGFVHKWDINGNLPF